MKQILYKDFKHPKKVKDILLSTENDNNKDIYNKIKKSRERPWFYIIRSLKLVKFDETIDSCKIKVTLTNLVDILFGKHRVTVFWIYTKPSPSWVCIIPEEGE